ncbi:hypothetical protein [Glycomyces sp. NPDC048151]|uniref:hypothetical protein n=1 Tax=Glycomyces sp. NPDC048151 TaxID=3364002 RepID=UPI0037185DCC
MRLKLGRVPASATDSGRMQRASWFLPAGTALGRFVEAGLRFEVQLAAERRLWLRCRPDSWDRDFAPVDVGPIVWGDNRSPHLNSIPEWLDPCSQSTALIVLKSTALYRAVVLGEALDPEIAAEVNSELGELVYQTDQAPQTC